MSGFEQQVFVTGLFLGLASSLHCLGMCGGVAAALSLGGARGASLPRALFGPMLLNGGRVLTYVVLGSIAGAVGTAALPDIGLSDATLLARAAGVVALSWAGLTLAGILPLPRLLVQIAYPVYHVLSDIRRRMNLQHSGEAVLTGIAWGFLPCAMVYGALFHAAFAGSWFGGGLAMLGYGLGTALPLVALGAGSPSAGRLAFMRTHPRVFGIALMALAVIGVAAPAGVSSILCLTP